MRGRWIAVIAAIAGLGIPALLVPAAAQSADPEPVGSGTPAAAAAQPTIQVDAAQQRGPVSPYLRGNNMVGSYQAYGGFDPDAGAVRPNLVRGVQRAGLTMLRYPGGTAGNTYPWKESIGPNAERGCYAPFLANQPPSDLQYGLDEHMAFSEKVGAENTVVVNFTTQDAAGAADMVEYLNAEVGTNPNGGTAWADVRAENGHSEPYDIEWFEIGNELGYPEGFWMGPERGAPRSELYVNGGFKTWTKSLAVSECDQRPATSVVTGEPDQRFFVMFPPVRQTSDAVFVGDVAWTRVDDLASAGPDDQVYVIDTATGEIHFGDGTHGARPATGATVSVTYDTGPHDGFLDFEQAMRAVDPDIKICTSQRDAHFAAEMGSKHTFDCMAAHFYPTPKQTDDPTELHDTAMNRAVNLAGRIDEFTQVMDDHGNRTADGEIPEVIVTEFGLGGGNPIEGYQSSLSVSLFVSTVLAGIADVGYPIAQKHILTNACVGQGPPELPTWAGTGGGNETFGCPDGGFVPQANAKLYELLKDGLGEQLVASKVTDNPVRDDFNDSGSRYPALVSTATVDDDGRLRLLVTNLDRAGHQARVDLEGFGRHDATVQVETLTGDSPMARNTPEDPDAVEISRDSVRVGQRDFDWRFPAHSVSVLTISPRK